MKSSYIDKHTARVMSGLLRHPGQIAMTVAPMSAGTSSHTHVELSLSTPNGLGDRASISLAGTLSPGAMASRNFWRTLAENMESLAASISSSLDTVGECRTEDESTTSDSPSKTSDQTDGALSRTTDDGEISGGQLEMQLRGRPATGLSLNTSYSPSSKL